MCVCVWGGGGGGGGREKEECKSMWRCEERKKKGECKGLRWLVSVVNNVGV